MTAASAPASSANLGPGYDVVALALSLRCLVTATPAAEWAVSSGGVAAADETAAMVQAVCVGAEPHQVVIESEIPVARGLGSSAALLVAAAAAVLGEHDTGRLFALAAEVEGHPDNVAAAVHGGLVAVGVDGKARRLGIHPSLHVVLAIPDEELPTKRARAVLENSVPRPLAVRTAGRLIALIEGLRTGDFEVLAGARGDEMHELPRRALTDTPARLIDAALGAGAAHAAWSGAGPAVIALIGEDRLDRVDEALSTALGDGGVTMELEVDRQGVRFE